MISQISESAPAKFCVVPSHRGNSKPLPDTPKNPRIFGPSEETVLIGMVLQNPSRLAELSDFEPEDFADDAIGQAIKILRIEFEQYAEITMTNLVCELRNWIDDSDNPFWAGTIGEWIVDFVPHWDFAWYRFRLAQSVCRRMRTENVQRSVEDLNDPTMEPGETNARMQLRLDQLTELKIRIREYLQ